MISWLAYVVIGLAVIAMVWGLVTAALNRPCGPVQLLYAVVVELGVAVQSVVAFVQIGTGFRPVELATTIGYLIGILVLMPVAWLWARSDRTRFSGLVLAVAGLAVGGMTLRLLNLWVPAGG